MQQWVYNLSGYQSTYRITFVSPRLTRCQQKRYSDSRDRRHAHIDPLYLQGGANVGLRRLIRGTGADCSTRKTD